MSQPSFSSASSSSPQGYAQVPRMKAHDPIPSPSRPAVDWASLAYNKILNSSPKFVKNFEARFYAWQKTWYSSTKGRWSDAKARCDVAEFNKLLEMGRSILPLVVYKLLDSRNFTGVFLYNALEQE